MSVLAENLNDLSSDSFGIDRLTEEQLKVFHFVLIKHDFLSRKETSAEKIREAEIEGWDIFLSFLAELEDAIKIDDAALLEEVVLEYTGRDNSVILPFLSLATEENESVLETIGIFRVCRREGGIDILSFADGFELDEDSEIVIPNEIDGRKVLSVSLHKEERFKFLDLQVVSCSKMYLNLYPEHWIANKGLNKDCCNSLFLHTPPDNWEELPSFAYEFCYARMKTFRTPVHWDEMASCSFDDNAFLKEAIITGNVAKVGSCCFRRCNSLEKVTIEEGVESLDYDLFDYSNVTEVHLPATLERMHFQFPESYTRSKVFFFVTENTYAEKYLTQNKCNVILEGESMDSNTVIRCIGDNVKEVLGGLQRALHEKDLAAEINEKNQTIGVLGDLIQITKAMKKFSRSLDSSTILIEFDCLGDSNFLSVYTGIQKDPSLHAITVRNTEQSDADYLLNINEVEELVNTQITDRYFNQTLTRMVQVLGKELNSF